MPGDGRPLCDQPARHRVQQPCADGDRGSHHHNARSRGGFLHLVSEGRKLFTIHSQWPAPGRHHVAEEFKNPKRDFHRSVLLSVVLIGLLYLSVAFVTVGTRAYEARGSVAPFAAIFSNVLGVYGAAGTAILAVVIIAGSINAYTAGMSRVVLAVARDGALPGAFARVSRSTGAPAGSLMLLTGLSLAMLFVYYVFDLRDRFCRRHKTPQGPWSEEVAAVGIARDFDRRSAVRRPARAGGSPAGAPWFTAWRSGAVERSA